MVAAMHRKFANGWGHVSVVHDNVIEASPYTKVADFILAHLLGLESHGPL